MQLKSINISLREYGAHEGRYTGNCSFQNQYGTVEVVMSPDMSDKVLQICAEAIVENARDMAQNLVAATLAQTQSPAIEDKR